MVKFFFMYKRNTETNPIKLIEDYLEAKKKISLVYDDSDIIFYNKYPLSIDELLNLEIHKNKKGIIIWVTDEVTKINFPKNILLFRTSLVGNNRNSNEHIFPWCSPILFKKDNYSIKNKSFEPIYNNLSIGFCGFVTNFCNKTRINLINYFENSKIKTNIIKRSKFIRGFCDEEQIKFRNIDFIDNMKNNIFILTPRGSGNWSLRFYETMTMEESLYY